MKITKNIGITLCLFCLIFNASAQSINWEEIQNGIWKASVGEPEDISLLKMANIQPKKEALEKLPDATFPFSKDKISTKVIDGKTYLRFPLTREEQLYGLGLNFKTVHQRGRIMTLHVDHYGGKTMVGRMHQCHFTFPPEGMVYS